jgi:UDP-N-acetylglucosamine/UDP-N-acetylgalactosamine diphosphorylase
MNPDAILTFLRRQNQAHILEHFDRLREAQKESFLNRLKGLDLELAFQLYAQFSREGATKKPASLAPPSILVVPSTPEEREREEQARRVGESLIRNQEVAVLIVAGGQGSRLGFSGPKGKFPITPVKKKPLFQLFAETIRGLQIRYRGDIPLLIMTSEENREETEEFFKGHRYWGLKKEGVHFFNQGMLPTLTPGGELILKDSGELLANPDGHGGSLKALFNSGLAQNFADRGVSEIFYCQVDNPLVRMADPVFIGYHRQAGAEISTKVVRRQNLEEKVGIYGLVNGRPTIVEYSDLDPEDYRALDEKGRIRYWAGNTAIHVISLTFVKRLNERGFALPYHRAVKSVEGLGRDGRMTTMPAWKFESFVFDAIPLAERTCCMEVIREEEFAPVKNQEGIDSPDTARRAMNSQHRSWLTQAGAEVSPDARVEISPLFALGKEELVDKLKGKKLVIRKDRYFG